MFQSPRSGQICSNKRGNTTVYCNKFPGCFNPLDRVKFVQIAIGKKAWDLLEDYSFNPLDRVKFVQIY